MTKVIYLDHAATTPTDKRVLEAMLPYFIENYGNAETTHKKGFQAKLAIDTARESISSHLSCSPSEIIFTGSGTESNNLAIFGVARANKQRGHHIITTKIEHSSVLHPCQQLEKEGFDITYLDVDKDGIVNPQEIKDSITDKTILVSVIYANNEIGSIQDIQAIGKICSKHKIPFHTDACQAASQLPINTQKLQVDLLTLNGSKLYGPKGVGALFIRQDINLKPILYGGSHENNKRAGTHNTPCIIGLAKALELIRKDKDSETTRLTELRNKLIDGLLQIPDAKLNGHHLKRLANNVNISFKNIEGRDLVMHLDEAGICASTGSACQQASDKSSHVLEAINLPTELQFGTIRLTLGKSTTEEEINYTIKTIKKLLLPA